MSKDQPVVFQSTEDGKWMTVEGDSQPECFGELWDGSKAGAEECKDCIFDEVCKGIMAKTTFTNVRKQFTNGTNLPELAKACNISEDSVLQLLAFLNGEALPKKKNPPIEEDAPVAKEETPKKKRGRPPKATVIDLLQIVAPVEEKRKRGRPKKIIQDISVIEPEVVKRGRGRPRKIERVAPVLSDFTFNCELFTNIAPEIVKRKRGRPKKEPEGENKENPTVAPSVVTARGRGSFRERSAKLARVRGGKLRRTPWKEHTFSSRWERERERNPILQKLEVGDVLVAERFGRYHKMKVVEKGYKGLTYRTKGKTYPTLNAITKVAAGAFPRPKMGIKGKRPPGTRKIADWNGITFWHVKKFLEEKKDC